MAKQWMVGVLGLGVGLAGCGSEPEVAFGLTSTLPERTQGVALDGSVARMGMRGQICDVDVLTAEVLGDSDPVGSDERVFHARDGAVLGSGEGTLFLSSPFSTARWTAEGTLLDGRITRDGTSVVLWEDAGTCRVGFVGPDDVRDALAVATDLDCSGLPGFAIAPDGAAWIADGQRLARVTADDALAWESRADRVVWAGDGPVVARTGESTVTAVDIEGEVRWEALVDGAITDLAAVAEEGPGRDAVAVMAEEPSGGVLSVLDGDGGGLAEHPLPSVADVVFSPDGTSMALQTPDGVVFYEVDAEPGAWSVGPGARVSRDASAAVTGAAVGGATVVSLGGVAMLALVVAD